MLRRFADARLRARLANAEASRDHYKFLAHALRDRVKELRECLAAQVEETQEVAAELPAERTRQQRRPRPHLEAVKARADRLAAALAESMRTQSVADVSVASWARWEALLTEHAEQQKETTP